MSCNQTRFTRVSSSTIQTTLARKPNFTISFTRMRIRRNLIILLFTMSCYFLFKMLRQRDSGPKKIDCTFDVRNYLLYVDSDFKAYQHDMLTTECKNLIKNTSLVKLVMFTDGHEIYQGCNATTPRCAERAHLDTNLNLTIVTPPCCRKHLVEIYHQVVDLFDKYDIKYTLFGGSVLGSVRHSGRMIPYDDDIDIAADIRDRPAFFMFVVPELQKSGRLVSDLSYRRWYHIYYSNVNYISLDLFWYVVVNESYMDFVITWTPPALFLPFQTMTFEGRVVRAPKNITGYMMWRYGKNWVNTHSCSHIYGHNCGD